MDFADFADVLGTVTDALSLPALLLAGYWYFIGRRRNERRLLSQTRHQPGHRPAAIIINCLTETSIINEVLHYLAATDGLKEIQATKRYESVTLSAKTIKPEDMATLARELRSAYSHISETGYDVLHVFCAAPMPVAMLTGAVLSNRGDVRLYHKSKTAVPKSDGGARDSYEYWGPLNY